MPFSYERARCVSHVGIVGCDKPRLKCADILIFHDRQPVKFLFRHFRPGHYIWIPYVIIGVIREPLDKIKNRAAYKFRNAFQIYRPRSKRPLLGASLKGEPCSVIVRVIEYSVGSRDLGRIFPNSESRNFTAAAGIPYLS